MTELKLTKCGYCCDLCKAYGPNIEKEDRREELSKIWLKYYGEDIPADEIYCNGCRCEDPSVKLMDEDCPVRSCNVEGRHRHCGECHSFPCKSFKSRQGLTRDDAKLLAKDFQDRHYDEFLIAYDNTSRIQREQDKKKREI